jgi:hypothetical protein
MAERVTALETWIAGHETLCAERYGSLRADLKWILRGIIGLLLAVSAWLAIQLWSQSQARILALEHGEGTARGAPASGLAQAPARPNPPDRPLARQVST